MEDPGRQQLSQQELEPPSKWLWGWQEGFDGKEEYRAPLPVTEEYPEVERMRGLSLPPYILARASAPMHAEVILCTGSGDGRDTPNAGDASVPEEWKRPIADALNLLGQRWPGVTINVRTKPDVDPDAP